MTFAIVEAGAIIYDEDTEQVAVFVSRKAANLVLSRLIATCPDAEIIEVRLEKK